MRCPYRDCSTAVFRLSSWQHVCSERRGLGFGGIAKLWQQKKEQAEHRLAAHRKAKKESAHVIIPTEIRLEPPVSQARAWGSRSATWVRCSWARAAARPALGQGNAGRWERKLGHNRSHVSLEKTAPQPDRNATFRKNPLSFCNRRMGVVDYGFSHA